MHFRCQPLRFKSAINTGTCRGLRSHLLRSIPGLQKMVPKKLQTQDIFEQSETKVIVYESSHYWTV